MLKLLSTHWQKWLAPKQPSKIPTETELKRWAYSEWIEYQAWLFHHSFLTLHDWQLLRENSLSWQHHPLISIITPVFNTLPAHLRECIYSVQTQAYPHWEICLVDDGSDNPATKEYLQTIIANEPRLHWHRFPNNKGICHATNQAITMARGEYIAFLDHDDRLAPDALYHIVETARNHPDADIIYSDRDSLSVNGFRLMHLLKPDWSPETLLSGNYLFHLVVYRRELIEYLGGVRTDLEGSQDYDLILRAAEKNPKVQHIPKVLYHWRQHKQSIAKEQNAKEYVYIAGVQALKNTLERRGLQGNVSENKDLWRGQYRVQLRLPPNINYQVLRLKTLDNYAIQINQSFERQTDNDYLIVLGPGVEAIDKESVADLISWLQINAVGMVTGKVLDKHGYLLHAGLVQRTNGLPLAVYAGFKEETPGYMAVTATVRNVSTPHPACCVVKRSLWINNQLNTDYNGPHALLDFALRAEISGHRTVYTPFARFMASNWQEPESWPNSDRKRFVEHWEKWLRRGDPYYSPYLTTDLVDMGLNLSWN